MSSRGSSFVTRVTDLDVFTRHLGEPVRRTQREWIYKCWMCGKPKLYVNTSTLQYKCWVCQSLPGGIGNYITFARLMHDENITRKPRLHTISEPVSSQVLHKAAAARRKVYGFLVDNLDLSDTHKAMLQESRGISDPSLEPYFLRSTDNAASILSDAFTIDELLAAGLYKKPDANSNAYPHKVIRPNRILIPYVLGPAVLYVRSRAVDPSDKLKYVGPVGVPTAKAVWGRIEPNSPYLIVTEGEFKAMCAVEHGYRCVAIPGINTAHEEVARLCKCKHVQAVFICFDTQIEGSLNVQAAANHLAGEILSKGIPVFNVSLPLDSRVSGGTKMDLDSMILHLGPASLDAAMAAASEYTQESTASFVERLKDRK